MLKLPSWNAMFGLLYTGFAQKGTIMGDKRTKMSVKELEQLRLFILLRAEESGPDGLSHELLFMSAKLAGFRLARENVDMEVQFLIDKKFLIAVETELGAGYKKCRIFADGRDYLARNGFEP